jgi:hypothetical protein
MKLGSFHEDAGAALQFGIAPACRFELEAG